MSQTLPVNYFEWIEKLLKLMKTSQKTIMKKVMKNIFLKLTSNTQNIYIKFTMIYPFDQKGWRLEN